METHKIEICETLCRVVEVQAEHAHEALEQVRGWYENSEIVLDAYDFQDVEIELL